MFLKNHTFTVFDTETTGLNPKSGDRIVEIAGVRVEGGEIQYSHTFTSLVNPECAFPPEARRINRITDEELSTAPAIAEVLPQFLEYAQNSTLVAHNAEFDLSFLESEKDGCWGYIDIPECLCTRNLSRVVCSQEYSHALDAVALRLGVEIPSANRHRALPDALLTAQILLRLIRDGAIASLDELRKKAAIKSIAWR